MRADSRKWVAEEEQEVAEVAGELMKKELQDLFDVVKDDNSSVCTG